MVTSDSGVVVLAGLVVVAFGITGLGIMLQGALGY